MYTEPTLPIVAMLQEHTRLKGKGTVRNFTEVMESTTHTSSYVYAHISSGSETTKLVS